MLLTRSLLLSRSIYLSVVAGIRYFDSRWVRAVSSSPGLRMIDDVMLTRALENVCGHFCGYDRIKWKKYRYIDPSMFSSRDIYMTISDDSSDTIFVFADMYEFPFRIHIRIFTVLIIDDLLSYTYLCIRGTVKTVIRQLSPRDDGEPKAFRCRRV